MSKCVPWAAHTQDKELEIVIRLDLEPCAVVVRRLVIAHVD